MIKKKHSDRSRMLSLRLQRKRSTFKKISRMKNISVFLSSSLFSFFAVDSTEIFSDLKTRLILPFSDAHSHYCLMINVKIMDNEISILPCTRLHPAAFRIKQIFTFDDENCHTCVIWLIVLVAWNALSFSFQLPWILRIKSVLCSTFCWVWKS